jgi:aspartate aminotransferase
MEFREEIKESLTLKFAEAAVERRKNNLPIISLGLGEPEFRTPNEIIEATIEVLRSKNSNYSSPMGIQSLREKIAARLKRENNINSQADNIIITPGAKQAFQLITMTLLKPEDEVIVLSPSFVSFIPQLFIAEPRCKIVEIDVNKEDLSLDLNEIKSAITPKTKLLVLNTPNNPAGYILDQPTLKAIYDLAVENNFYIISDEIYEKLIYGESEHFSIGSLEKEPTKVITINGFSKSHAMTGWRIGYACFPLVLKTNLLKLQQHTNTNTCTFIQEGLDISFNHDYKYLTEYNYKLKNRMSLYSEFLDSTPLVKGFVPSAGFFAFMDIKDTNIDSNTFCGRLIKETGVATTPGIAFGKNWDDHVRFSFATSDDNVIEGLNLVKNFIKTSL